MISSKDMAAASETGKVLIVFCTRLFLKAGFERLFLGTWERRASTLSCNGRNPRHQMAHILKSTDTLLQYVFSGQGRWHQTLKSNQQILQLVIAELQLESNANCCRPEQPTA